MDVLHYGEESVSVAIEEVAPGDWMKPVYKPDIETKWDKLYEEPGYEPFQHFWPQTHTVRVPL